MSLTPQLACTNLHISASPRIFSLPVSSRSLHPSIQLSLVQHIFLGFVDFQCLCFILRAASTLNSCCIDLFVFPFPPQLPSKLVHDRLEYLSIKFIPPDTLIELFDFSGLKRLRRLKFNRLPGPGGFAAYAPNSAPALEEIHVNYHSLELDQALSTSSNIRRFVLSDAYHISAYTNTSPTLPAFFLHLDHITIVHPPPSPLLSGTLIFRQMIPFLDLPHLIFIDLDIPRDFVMYRLQPGSLFEMKSIRSVLLNTDPDIVRSIHSALNRGVIFYVKDIPVTEWLPTVVSSSPVIQA